MEPIRCFDCPRRKDNYCHFYLSSTALAMRICTMCITCKNANWVNKFYMECEGCIIDEKGTRAYFLEREGYRLDENLGWVR